VLEQTAAKLYWVGVSQCFAFLHKLPSLLFIVTNLGSSQQEHDVNRTSVFMFLSSFSLLFLSFLPMINLALSLFVAPFGKPMMMEQHPITSPAQSVVGL
jgi:hypothetical protein